MEYFKEDKIILDLFEEQKKDKWGIENLWDWFKYYIEFFPEWKELQEAYQRCSLVSQFNWYFRYTGIYYPDKYPWHTKWLHSGICERCQSTVCSGD